MADRFYTPDALGPGEVVLDGAEAHHLTTVRRLGPGSSVMLFNGDGNEYPAEVIAAGKKSVTLHIRRVETLDRELAFPVVVASALPKGDRADFLIEKLTELGVTRFVPLITGRAVVRPKDNAVEKFTRAVIEASKQCGRNRLMAVDEPCEWKRFLALRDLPESRYLLHTSVSTERLVWTGKAVAIAIGPEGGFTEDEVTAAVNHGWRLATLGPRVLRIETAAIAAAAVLAVSQ